THGGETDVEQPRDIAVGAAARDQHGDVALALGQRLEAVDTALHGTVEERLQRIQQVDFAALEVRAAGSPPNPEIAEFAIAVEHVHVDPVIEAVAGEEVVV